MILNWFKKKAITAGSTIQYGDEIGIVQKIFKNGKYSIKLLNGTIHHVNKEEICLHK